MALAILSSDALSSVASATEEMLRVLIPAVGVAAFGLGLPIGGAIIGLLLLLVFSYRQTIKAYPSAGGAYIVTRDNFGLVPAQVAGVALLLDYIMTVAVSIAAAVAALYSYFPALFSYRLVIAVALIWLVAWGNLRGVRATGRIFAAPTYFFLLAIAALVAAGGVAALRGNLHPMPPPSGLPVRTMGAVGWMLILHAYASGTTALTGVEAISNGVSVFRPVEWQNARRVLVWMGTILAISFGSITVLAWKLRPLPTERKTMVSEMGAVLFGHGAAGRLGLLLLQIATTLILVLAANTSFSDFPRLASFHAGDGYLPRTLRRRGSRLVFSTGICLLAALATLVIIIVGADVHRLIPLYAVGVFASFTFSQAGMTVRHLRLREPAWRRGFAINAAGCVGSAVALAAILVSKFPEGAWAVTIIVPAGVGLLLAVHRHYERVDAWLSKPDVGAAAWRRLRAVVLASPDDVALSEAAGGYVRHLGPDGTPSESATVSPDVALGIIDQEAEKDVLTLLVLPRWPGQADPRPWEPPARLRRRALRHPNVAVATLRPERGRPIGENDRHAAVVLVERPGALARRGLAIAQSLGPDELHALHVRIDEEQTQAVLEQWDHSGLDLPLEVMDAPYREPGGPLCAEIELLRQQGCRLVTVVAPSLLLPWWQRPLYEDRSRALRGALAGTSDTALVECRMALRTVPS
jgi:amino acid transporter